MIASFDRLPVRIGDRVASALAHDGIAEVVGLTIGPHGEHLAILEARAPISVPHYFERWTEAVAALNAVEEP